MPVTTVAAFFILFLAATSVVTWAQQPGTNVNVLPAYPNGAASPPFPPLPISVTDATRGDGYLQRQVEPTVAPSTYNPDHILAAFGDYRTTSIPNDTGLPGTAASGWIGLSRSYDRGHTWFGTLVPCFPQDKSAVCAKSPLTGLQTGSDPTLATTPGGHFYLGALFFTPGHISNVAVVHYRDVPDTDGGDTIRYQGAVIVDKGSVADSGNFIDKPAIAADIARGTASASVCGPVYMAYTIFVGGGGTAPFTSKVGFSRSRQGNCGSSWDHQLYLNKNYKQNQGTAIGVDPRNGKIYVVWRHIFQPGGDGFPDSIVMASSTDGGATFSNPAPITTSIFAPIDQPGLATTNFPNNPAFRSNSFPSIAVDGNGNVYVADQEKVLFSSGHPAGYYEPRVVIRTSRNAGGSWTTGSIVDPGTGAAQQFMPVLSFAGGLLKVMWYDSREQNQVSDNVAEGWFVTGLDRQMKTYVAQSNLSAPFDSFGNPKFSSSVPVTQYLIETGTGQLPTVGNAGVDSAVNRPNLPMYSAGTTPFTGDYIGMMTASPFVPNPGGSTAFRWATNPTDYIAMPSFGVWTDSRDVVFPTFNFGKPTLNDLLGWTQYAPPGTGSSCTNAGSRNANVYLSEIKPGVIAGSPATSRQLVDASGAPMERAFPIYIQNPNTDAPSQSTPGKFFHISFNPLNSPLAGSFAQGTELQVPTTAVDLNILQYSTATVTLYVYCTGCSSSRPLVPFAATVQETKADGTIISGGATTTIFFDSDPTAPFVTNTNLGMNEFHNASVSNPQYTNPQYTNPQYTNPQYTNPQYTNPQYTNIAPINAAPVGDFVWTVTDMGNNASAYAAVANIANNPNYIYETIISRSYNFPGFSGCNSQPIPQDAIISIIPNPQYTNPQYTNPQYTNPQYTNPQYTNASFAAVPPPAGNTASAAITTSSTDASTSTDDGTTKMPVGTDHVYVVLRVYRASGVTTPLTTDEQNAVIANTTLLVFPQAPTTGTGTPTPQPIPPASTNKVFTSTSLGAGGVPNPQVFGQPVTFTATVTPASGSNPGGTVDFKDGSTLIQTVPMSGGAAVLQVSTLAEGVHTITAVYSGDTNFVGSVSNSVSETIVPPTLVFTNQPADTGVGLTMSNVVVTITNPLNNSTLPYSNPITLTLTNPGSATLVGTTTQSANNNGVATFSGLSITSMAQGYALSASSSGMTGATSNTFNVDGVLFVGTDTDVFHSSGTNRLGRFTFRGALKTGGTLIPITYPLNGVALNRGNLFAGDPETNTLRTIDFDGNVISSIQAGFPNNACCNEGMVLDSNGTTLWHAYYPNAIQTVTDFTTGALVNSYDATEPVGITFVGNQLWITEWSPHAVGTYDYTTNPPTFTKQFDTIPPAAGPTAPPTGASPVNAGGLAYDSVNNILWVGMGGGWLVPYDLIGGSFIYDKAFQPFGSILDTVDGLAFVSSVPPPSQ